MRRIGVFIGLLSVLLLAMPLATQEEDGNVALVIFLKAKPGMDKQLEEGAKKHMAFHRQHNDPWAWHVWQVASGDNTGMYVAATFGHSWADFDTSRLPREADEADADANIHPYVGWEVVRYYASLGKVSRPPEGEGPMPLSQVITFHVRYGKSEEFTYLVKKFHKAIEKTNWPVHYLWYQLVNGGEAGTYVLVLPRANWAAFKPQEKSFAAMLEEAYGRPEAESLLKKWSRIMKGASSHTSRYRPELSYIPASQ